MILVAGATGLLGSMITQQLLHNKKETRVLIRENSIAEEMALVGLGTPAEILVTAGAQPVYGDLKNRPSLDEACRGVSTVITTANSVLRGGEDTIESVDLKGTQNLIDAAREAGVQKFTYVSVLGADSESPNSLGQVKALCEMKLQESGMDYTILQPGIFMEVWVGLVVGAPLQTGSPVTLVEPGSHKHAFVSARDVAAYAVKAVDHGAARKAIIRIGGPEAYSWNDIVNTAGEIMGHPLPVNYVSAGDPIPTLPEAVVPLMYGFETYESYINMNAAMMLFNIQPTSLETFMQGFISAVAEV
jgi:NADH dehydrogenase